MQLLELTSNKKSFKSVIFNESGLSIIRAKKKNKEDKDSKKTTNGVGKSLCMYLILFCLGSDKNEELEKKLPGWEFTLKFKLGNAVHTASRSTDNQEVIHFDKEEISYSKFKEKFKEDIFSLNKKIKFLTPWAILQRFIRPRKDSYQYFDTPVAEEKPYSKLICAAYLLGINPEIIDKKRELREEWNKLNKLRINFNKDPIFKEYFNEGLEFSMMDLEDKIKNLVNKKNNFKIAENYEEIQIEIEEIRNLLETKRNELFIVNEKLSNIENSLRIKSELSREELVKIYEETKVSFPEDVLRTLKELEDFHKSIQKKRVDRLTNERYNLIKEKKELELIQEKLENNLNSKIGLIINRGNLKEYETLCNEINDSKNRLDKLGEYKKISESYEKKQKKLEKDLAEENILTDNYLKNIEDLKKEINTLFRTYSKNFYHDKPGGIEIKNNSGENLLRFNINASIKDDTSDGVNQVKIFCFDMLLLKLQINHKIKFLFHDSRLFGDMDTRQKSELFKTAFNETDKSEFQYICSINEDQLVPIKEYIGESNYKKIVEEKIILDLTDEGEEGKLLGIQVDLKYEKKGN